MCDGEGDGRCWELGEKSYEKRRQQLCVFVCDFVTVFDNQ